MYVYMYMYIYIHVTHILCTRLQLLLCIFYVSHYMLYIRTTIHISTTCSNEILQQHTAQATANYQRVHKFPNLIGG